MSDLVGRRLGDYQVEALVGAGSTGHVYRATHTPLGVPVALKVIDRQLAASPEFKTRFVQHAETLTAIRNDYAVRVHHVGEQGGSAYIVMELLPGRNCESLRPEAPIAEWTASSWRMVDLARQAAEGVAAAHERGILHGDIKLSNLLLTSDDPRIAQVKVTDFGWRRLAIEAQMAGDPGGGVAPDARDDVYALGRVLYELTAGCPLSGSAAAGAHYGVVPPRKLVAGYPEALESIVMRCLATRPDDRFGSALELSRFLGAAISVAGGAAPLPGPRAPRGVPFAPAYPGALSMVVGKPPRAPDPAPGSVPSLHVMDADHVSIAVRHLRPAGLKIGSASDSDIVLEAEGASPVHARVDFDGRRVSVTDLGSLDGTLLEGHRLLPQVPQEWGREQWLQIGSCWLWVQQPAVPAPLKVVEVMLDQSGRQMSITPGKPAACHVTLLNQTIQVDLVTLSVEGVPAEWVVYSQRETRLQPHAKKDVTLTVNVPRTPAGRAGDYRVTIRVNSTANPEIEQGSVTAHWTVLPFHAMSASITPSKSSAAREAKFTVTLQNDGGAPANYMLNASDDERHLEYLLSGEGINDVNRLPLSLQPGAKIRVGLKVVAPRRWFGTPSTHGFTVEAVADEEQPAVTTEAQFVHRPTLPWWTLAVVPVVLLGVYIFGTRYLKPVVETVYVEPRTPLTHQRVEISWDAPKATRIRIFVNDIAVLPDPDIREGRYVFSEGFEKDTRIRVLGSNIFGEASLPVTVIVKGVKPPPPPVEMTVNPPVVVAGGAVTITWRITGATRAEFNLTGSVPLQGSYIDRPAADQTYTITAFNDEVATTRSIPVKVSAVPPPPIPRPSGLVLAIASPRPKNNKPLTIDVNDSIVLEWAVKDAQSVRIDGITPVKLEGSSGQRTAQLKGEGRYTFTLVATDEKNQEFRSEPVEVMADCGFVDGILFKCNKNLELVWK